MDAGLGLADDAELGVVELGVPAFGDGAPLGALGVVEIK